MTDKTKIEWTDATWNPVTGCTKVSAGCDHCYAETIATRFAGSKAYPHGFDVTLRPERLPLPLKWQRPRRIFVNSMSDLFHSSVPDEYIARVFAVMAATPRHTYQILTKRHGRLRTLLQDRCRCAASHAAGIHFRSMMCDQARSIDGVDPHAVYFEPPWPLPNVWIGVSVEDQATANLRIPALLETPAARRFLSCEPLLGPVDLSTWLGIERYDSFGWGQEMFAAMNGRVGPAGGLHWVIAGGESGHGARPMHPDWARQLRDQCVAARVPFHFKQWGEYSLMAPLNSEGHRDWDGGITLANDGTVYKRGDLDYPDGPRRREAIHAHHDRASLTAMYRVGKKTAGRELDGRTWDEFPEVAHA